MTIAMQHTRLSLVLIKILVHHIMEPKIKEIYIIETYIYTSYHSYMTMPVSHT